MIEQAHVGMATDPSLEEVRRAVVAVVDALAVHLGRLAELPPGETSFVRLAELNEPVRRAVARWDHAVLVRTETLPLALDDGWPEGMED